jgi:hypothetical protein
LFKGKSPFLSKLIFYLLLGFWTICFICLSRNWQVNVIIKYISNPTRVAYKVIKENISHIDDDTVLYIDAEDEAAVKNNLLSGMGELGVSIHYNYDGVTKFAYSFEDLCSKLRNGKIKLDEFYTFFASEKLGLVPTTDQFKKELYQKLPRKQINKWMDYGVYLESIVDFPIFMPAKLTITISSTPTNGKISSEPQTIKLWWLTERARTYRPYYLKEISIAPDGRAHTYSVIIPAGGLTVQSLRIDSYLPNQIKILDASIVNLTIPEVASEKELNCK